MNHTEVFQANKPEQENGIYFIIYHLKNSEIVSLKRTYLTIFDADSDLRNYYSKQKDDFSYTLSGIIHGLNYDGETSEHDFPNSIETMLLKRKHESNLNELVANIKQLAEKMSLTPTIEFKKQTF